MLKAKATDPDTVRNGLSQAGLAIPRILTVAITDLCNLKCSHCLVEAGPCESAAQVDPQQLNRLCRDFAALGGEEIRLTGGEPLCHPQWLKIIQQVYAAGLPRLSLQTNATLIDTAAALDLQKLPTERLSIQVSLEGASAQSHDLVRGDGSFARTMAGLRRLVETGLGKQVTILFTEMRHNLREIPRLLELAEELDLGSIRSGTLVAGGRAAEQPDEAIAPPSPGQYLQLLDDYDHDAEFQRRYARLGNVAALEWYAGRGQGPCCKLIEQPYLTTGGRLYPCTLFHADPFSVCDTYLRGLPASLVAGTRLWASLQQQCLRREAGPDCHDCREKTSCRAGCPGRAWGSYGDFMLADDRCELQKQISLRRNR